MDQAGAEQFRKNSGFGDWDYVGEIVKNTKNIIKVSVEHGSQLKQRPGFLQYGLYDRPELKAWHKQRVCLIGDAAHPTSPVRFV